MSASEIADLGVRALCGVIVVLIFGIVIFQGAKIGAMIGATMIASPFLLTALAPNVFGGAVGKGMIFVMTVFAFYDPPSSITFELGRMLFAVPFMLLGVLLAVREARVGLVHLIMRSTSS